MRKSRFSSEQIMLVVKELEGGGKAAELGRRLGVSRATLYRWKTLYGGLDVDQVQQLNLAMVENRQLKQLVGELSMDVKMLKAVLGKKSWGPPDAGWR